MPASESSLRRRLLVGLLATTALAWIAAAVATYADLHRDIDQLLDTHLRHSAHLLIAQSAHEITEIDEEDLDELDVYEQVVAFQVWDVAGNRLLLRSRDAPDRRFSTVAVGFSDGDVGGRRWRVFSGWDRRHRVLVQVAEDETSRAALVRRLALNTLAPLAILLPVLGVLVAWTVRGATLPLVRLSDEVAARNAADLRPLPDRSVPAEAQPLVRRLNELFARIGILLDSERRFTSHAAHELRTPVAAVRAQAEVASLATDPTTRRTALAGVIEGCDRMARLIEQLLSLARIDASDARRQFAPLRLDELVRRELRELAPAAVRMGGSIALENAQAITISGDAELIALVVRNLVDNALRHSGPQPAVVVYCEEFDGMAQLRVSDAGPPLDPADIAQMGRRFFRAAGTRAAGSGLGLSMAARIAELHAGELRFQPGADGCGLVAILRVPIVAMGAGACSVCGESS